MDTQKTDRPSGSMASDDELLRETGEIIIPLVNEEIEASTRLLQTRIRIRTAVASHVERVEVPLKHDTFEVKRVPVGRIVDEAVHTRIEDGVTIIPVMEERIITSKQLVLLEEIHLIPRSSTEIHVEDVALRREVVTVERFPGSTETINSDD